MSRFPKVALIGLLTGLAFTSVSYAAGDAEAGAKVFKKCASCHAVGDGAANKVGPELNDLFGRKAGSVEGYSYSSAMTDSGIVWDEKTLAEFLHKPKDMIKGTKMGFPGLKKEKDVENVLAYLGTFSANAPSAEAAPAAPADATKTAEAAAPAAPAAADTKAADTKAADTKAADTKMAEASVYPGAGQHFKLGRVATEEEVSAWNIDVRPDGQGLPVGSGTVAEGQQLYDENCAVCHGDFGEGMGRWPVLAGGQGTLKDDRPVKTVGSYWPYLSTVYDYIRRAMPFGNARAFTDDQYYSLTAYLLYLNDIVTDDKFTLSNENFLSVKMPNADGFIKDNRLQEEHYDKARGEPCMTDCKPGKPEITMHAAVIDVTPDANKEDGPSGGAID